MQNLLTSTSQLALRSLLFATLSDLRAYLRRHMFDSQAGKATQIDGLLDNLERSRYHSLACNTSSQHRKDEEHLQQISPQGSFSISTSKLLKLYGNQTYQLAFHCSSHKHALRNVIMSYIWTEEETSYPVEAIAVGY